MTTASPPDLVDGRWPVTACASAKCGAPIVWARTEKGKNMPVDAEPTAAGRYRLEDRGGDQPVAVYTHPISLAQAEAAGKTVVVHSAHWATCPSERQFRRPR